MHDSTPAAPPRQEPHARPDGGLLKRIDPDGTLRNDSHPLHQHYTKSAAEHVQCSEPTECHFGLLLHLLRDWGYLKHPDEPTLAKVRGQVESEFVRLVALPGFDRLYRRPAEARELALLEPKKPEPPAPVLYVNDGDYYRPATAQERLDGYRAADEARVAAEALDGGVVG